jgi:hypothetical protein
MKRFELQCGIGFRPGGFELAPLVKNGYPVPGSSGVLHGAGLLEIDVRGGVGSIRLDWFAGRHFCVFSYSQSLV